MYSHGGGLSCAIVSQERCDLSLIEAERQSIYGQLLPVAVNFDQVLDVDPGLQVSRLLLYAHG